MEEQYGMGDLRHFMNGRSPIFPPPNPPDLRYDMVMGLGRHDIVGVGGPLHHHHQFDLIRPESANTNSSSAAAASGSTVPCGGGGGGIGIGFMTGLDMDGVGGGLTAGDGGNGRWPRQETLTLLEIRSRLDPKFKEANQKGPLWDEVSRIMSEEHGYQRSGKKCREKFENLYKYYKKTKEGKAGRQDGKHYRFFRQLEALYGEPSSNNINNNASASTASENHPISTMIGQEVPFHGDHSLSLSNNNNSSEFDTSSSEDSELSDSKGRKRKAKRSWKTKIKDFIDSQMKKLMEKQEAWLEKIMKTIEQKEQERVVREEEWRKQEAARVDREHAFWANERSWIESRDSAMMEALRTLTGKEVVKDFPTSTNVVAEHNGSHETINSIMKSGDHHGWPECEITRLIQLRTSMEARFHQIGCPEEIVWEEIAAKMACLGYDRTPLMCKEKWDNVSNYLIKCSKKRKENSRFACFLTNESVTSHGGVYSCEADDQQAMRASDHHHDSGNVMHDGSSYRFAMDHTENLWDNYGVKFSKGDN